MFFPVVHADVFIPDTEYVGYYDYEGIFTVVGNVNSQKPNSHKIIFSNEQSVTANFVLSNIDGNSLSRGNFILVIKPSSNIQNSSSEIPAWIKNNAAWWSDGTINDDSFLQGIQFLIKEGILQISI